MMSDARIIKGEALASLIPHKGKMVLLSRIREYNLQEHSLTAEYEVTPDCLFYDEHLGGLPSWVSFEFMAQSISALSGLYGREQGEKPKIGFILSVSAMNIQTPVLKAGKTLQIRVKEDYRVDLVYSFNSEVFLGDETVAKAKLTVMDVDDAFMKTMQKEP